MNQISSNNEKGFSLIECIFAMVILMVGTLAAAGLIVTGIRFQVESRDSTSANTIARSKVEQLRHLSPSSPGRARGGSLTSDATGYNDTSGRYRRRWLIETAPADAGVPANTQRITVAIFPSTPGVLLPSPSIEISTLMPGS